jgi:hypothetical protein
LFKNQKLKFMKTIKCVNEEVRLKTEELEDRLAPGGVMISITGSTGGAIAVASSSSEGGSASAAVAVQGSGTAIAVASTGPACEPIIIIDPPICGPVPIDPPIVIELPAEGEPSDTSVIVKFWKWCGEFPLRGGR